MLLIAMTAALATLVYWNIAVFAVSIDAAL
jgi:hypothetical protein